MAKHVYTYIDPPSERDLEEAVRFLESEGLIAYPTDVNWAVGCDAASVKAVDRMRRLKPGHPKDQPFSLICSSISMVSKVANVEGATYRILKQVLPGPFTFLLSRNRNLPRQINDKRRVVGVRVPDSPLLLALVEKLGRPLATTSLPIREESRSGGGESLKYGYQVDERYGHALDLILDLGQEVSALETTVVDLTGDGPVVVRDGVGRLPSGSRDERSQW